MKAIRVEQADDFAPALRKALKSGEPYLIDVPMENIPVPTPGCWNINDIYRPNELVREGKLVKKADGKYIAPVHGASHK